jgi:YD repeat-containing protein
MFQRCSGFGKSAFDSPKCEPAIVAARRRRKHPTGYGSGTFTSTGFQATNEINETRTFNVANEMASRVDNSVTKSPAYDANGNLTDDGVNYTYVYDAFGRLRTVKNRSNAAVVEENHYNGLNQRIGWHYDVDADGDVDGSDP